MILAFLINTSNISLPAQTTGFSPRISFGLEKKVIKNLTLEVTPEVRFEQGFKPSNWLVQAGLDYKPVKWLKVGALYRFKTYFETDPESGNYGMAEYSNRFAVDATGNFNIGRLHPQIRLRFCNFTDFNSATDDKTNYMRYRFKLGYDIKGIPLEPFISWEMFQKLSSGLFSESRYSIGAEYRINGRNSISLDYSYDERFKSQNVSHILELGYKIKL